MESNGGAEAIRPSTAVEEALKRNTDCVYFLASPLTCKKVPFPLSWFMFSLILIKMQFFIWAVRVCLDFLSGLIGSLLISGKIL